MAHMVPWFGGYEEVWDFEEMDLDLDLDYSDYAGGGRRGGRRRRRKPRGGGGGANNDMVHVYVGWRETENHHVFRVDLPGGRKEHVKVEVEDGNILQISGELVKEEENENDKWHRMERRRGPFLRRFKLPKNANLVDIKCFMENGVLTVTVGKKETDGKGRNIRAIDIE